MNPVRDDNETTTQRVVACPVCAATFHPVRRQTYCSPACKQVAWRERSRPDPRQPAIPVTRARDHTVYQCIAAMPLPRPAVVPRLHPALPLLGPRGSCGHCGELLTVEELLTGQVES